MLKKIVILSIVLFALAGNVIAGTFTESFVRLDRQKSGLNTTGLICVKPQSVGVEDSVSVEFPHDFVISSNTSLWTVSTSDIPQGSTAWPGIGTATSVSSKTVNFPSSDLSIGTLYCFRWTNSDALQSGNPGNKTMQITTFDGSNNEIDDTGEGIALRINTNDQVSVNASVPVKSTDYSIDFNSVPDNSQELDANEVIEFTVEFTSNLPYDADVVIESYWEDGIGNVTNENISDVFTYVSGSASLGTNSTPATIDIQNQRITWNISNFPANSTDTFTYQLKVNPNIITTQSIFTQVIARSKISSTYSPEQKIAFTIKKAPVSTSDSSGSSPTATPVPTSNQTDSDFSMGSVYFNSISADQANFVFNTTKPARYRINYGTSPSLLDRSTETSSFNYVHNVSLRSLIPNTQYYFIIQATDQNGSAITSSLYTFTTAKVTNTFELTTDSLNILADSFIVNTKFSSNILLPLNKKFTIYYELSNPENIFEITAGIQKAGLANQEGNLDSASTNYFRLIEVAPGKFSGELYAPGTPGNYEIVFTIYDIHGGVYKKIAPYTLVVVNPIKVVDASTLEPIEAALIKIYRFEDSTKTYTLLTEGFQIENKTNAQGELPVVLPFGDYIFEVSAPGYALYEEKYTISDDNLLYPLIKLTSGFNLIDFYKTYSNWIKDISTYVHTAIDNFFNSSLAYRLFNILNQIIILYFLLLLIGYYFGIHLIYLPLMLWNHLLVILKKDSHLIPINLINNTSKNNIPFVFVKVESEDKIYITFSNWKGIAYVPTNLLTKNSYLSFKKREYMTKSISDPTISDVINQTISLEQRQPKSFLSNFLYLQFFLINESLLLLMIGLALGFILSQNIGLNVPLVLSIGFYVLILVFLVKHFRFHR